MKQRIGEHIIGIIFVTLVMTGALVILEGRVTLVNKPFKEKIASFSSLPITKINDPFEHALLSDCMDLFYPGQHDSNQIILNELFHIRETRQQATFTPSPTTSSTSPHSTLSNILPMYINFVIIYLLVMILTYYAVQTLGALRFILRQQQLFRETARSIDRRYRMPPSILLFNIVKIAAYVVLFSPAYVIAYSIRTEFNTDSSFFMIILALLSNGLLITYTNKFYTFLVAESRKGYVENALVKNLRSDYRFSPKGIPLSSLLSRKKRFTGHVFDPIFRNARFQYLATVKEQASFLITGLVIIEMALNIHGHLTYELLRQILYKNYTAVIIIMLLIFYTVKMTEIITDLLIHREAKRYENR